MLTRRAHLPELGQESRWQNYLKRLASDKIDGPIIEVRSYKLMDLEVEYFKATEMKPNSLTFYVIGDQ